MGLNDYSGDSSPPKESLSQSSVLHVAPGSNGHYVDIPLHGSNSCSERVGTATTSEILNAPPASMARYRPYDSAAVGSDAFDPGFRRGDTLLLEQSPSVPPLAHDPPVSAGLSCHQANVGFAPVSITQGDGRLFPTETLNTAPGSMGVYGAQEYALASKPSLVPLPGTQHVFIATPMTQLSAPPSIATVGTLSPPILEPESGAELRLTAGCQYGDNSPGWEALSVMQSSEVPVSVVSPFATTTNARSAPGFGPLTDNQDLATASLVAQRSASPTSTLDVMTETLNTAPGSMGFYGAQACALAYKPSLAALPGTQHVFTATPTTQLSAPPASVQVGSFSPAILESVSGAELRLTPGCHYGDNFPGWEALSVMQSSEVPVGVGSPFAEPTNVLTAPGFGPLTDNQDVASASLVAQRSAPPTSALDIMTESPWTGSTPNLLTQQTASSAEVQLTPGSQFVASSLGGNTLSGTPSPGVPNSVISSFAAASKVRSAQESKLSVQPGTSPLESLTSNVPLQAAGLTLWAASQELTATDNVYRVYSSEIRSMSPRGRADSVVAPPWAVQGSPPGSNAAPNVHPDPCRGLLLPAWPQQATVAAVDTEEPLVWSTALSSSTSPREPARWLKCRTTQSITASTPDWVGPCVTAEEEPYARIEQDLTCPTSSLSTQSKTLMLRRGFAQEFENVEHQPQRGSPKEDVSVHSSLPSPALLSLAASSSSSGTKAQSEVPLEIRNSGNYICVDPAGLELRIAPAGELDENHRRLPLGELVSICEIVTVGSTRWLRLADGRGYACERSKNTRMAAVTIIKNLSLSNSKGALAHPSQPPAALLPMPFFGKLDKSQVVLPGSHLETSRQADWEHDGQTFSFIEVRTEDGRVGWLSRSSIETYQDFPTSPNSYLLVWDSCMVQVRSSCVKPAPSSLLSSLFGSTKEKDKLKTLVGGDYIRVVACRKTSSLTFYKLFDESGETRSKKHKKPEQWVCEVNDKGQRVLEVVCPEEYMATFKCMDEVGASLRNTPGRASSKKTGLSLKHKQLVNVSERVTCSDGDVYLKLSEMNPKKGSVGWVPFLKKGGKQKMLLIAEHNEKPAVAQPQQPSVALVCSQQDWGGNQAGYPSTLQPQSGFGLGSVGHQQALFTPEHIGPPQQLVSWGTSSGGYNVGCRTRGDFGI